MSSPAREVIGSARLHWNVAIAIVAGSELILPRVREDQFIDFLFFDYWRAGALLGCRRPRKSIPRATRLKVIEEAEGACWFCVREKPDLTIDHIAPVSFGGSDDIVNLRAACFACNVGYYRETFARFGPMFMAQWDGTRWRTGNPYDG